MLCVQKWFIYTAIFSVVFLSYLCSLSSASFITKPIFSSHVSFWSHGLAMRFIWFLKGLNILKLLPLKVLVCTFFVHFTALIWNTVKNFINFSQILLWHTLSASLSCHVTYFKLTWLFSEILYKTMAQSAVTLILQDAILGHCATNIPASFLLFWNMCTYSSISFGNLALCHHHHHHLLITSISFSWQSFLHQQVSPDIVLYKCSDSNLLEHFPSFFSSNIFFW